MIPNKHDKRGNMIIEFLQNNGANTYHQIEEYLIKNNEEYSGEKALNRKLSDMMKEGTIERLEQKGKRSAYRIRLDTFQNIERHGTFFKEYMRNQFVKNRDLVFEEISSKNKIQNKDEAYLKKWIEYFGLYIFTALMESNAVVNKIQLDKTSGSERYELMRVWLSKALNLEEGSMFSRSSTVFFKMIDGFKNSDKETSDKTMMRIDESMKKLYPQTTGIIINAESISDNILEMLQEKKYKSLKQFDKVMSLLSGNVSKEEREEFRDNILKKKFNSNF